MLIHIRVAKDNWENQLLRLPVFHSVVHSNKHLLKTDYEKNITKYKEYCVLKCQCTCPCTCNYTPVPCPEGGPGSWFLPGAWDHDNLNANVQLCHLQLCDFGQETSSSLRHLNCHMEIKTALTLQGYYSFNTLLLKEHLSIWHCSRHSGLGIKMHGPCSACVKNKAGILRLVSCYVLSTWHVEGLQ